MRFKRRRSRIYFQVNLRQHLTLSGRARYHLGPIIVGTPHRPQQQQLSYGERWVRTSWTFSFSFLAVSEQSRRDCLLRFWFNNIIISRISRNGTVHNYHNCHICIIKSSREIFKMNGPISSRPQVKARKEKIETHEISFFWYFFFFDTSLQPLLFRGCIVSRTTLRSFVRSTAQQQHYK